MILYRVFILILVSSRAFGEPILAPLCRNVFKEHENTLERIIISRRPPEAQPSRAVDSLYGLSFQNGAFLRMFFGPEMNRFPQWLQWLKDGDPRAFKDEFEGLGAYRGRHGIVIARPLETPFDLGRDYQSANNTVLPIMQLPISSLAQLKGTTAQAVIARRALLDQLNLHLFGVYAALEISRQSEQSPMLKEALDMIHTSQSPALDAAIHPRVPYRLKDKLLRPVEPLSTENTESPLRQLYEVVEVIATSNDSVVIKVPLGKDHAPKNKIQEIIQQMFFITYWQMVQKAYRESKLFPDEIDTALYLMENFVKTMKESSDQQTLYLLYDRMAWQVIEFRMALANKYVSINMHGAGWQPYRYETIADVFSPLFPTLGMTVEKYPTGEYEVKRLFHNKNDDPMKILPEPQWPKNLSMWFYHQAAKDLPEGSDLVAISKTKIHNRMYKAMGFRVVDETFNPEWNSPMFTLRTPLATFIEETGSKATSPAD